jgi:DNA-binding FadR family transcriptional regulator
MSIEIETEPETRTRNHDAAGRLRAYLADSNLELNSRLPPERTLSRQLGVSRSLLRRALAELEAEGQIWRHVGRGTFVGSRPLESASDIDYVSSHTTPRELMEARLLIELGLARLAASHASNADIRELEHCIRKTKSAADWRIYEIWDINLHRAIAAAAHNTCLMALFDILNAVKRSVVWARPREVPLARKLDHHSFSEHDAIISAIIGRDPVRAEAAMRRHLESVRERLMEVMEPSA